MADVEVGIVSPGRANITILACIGMIGLHGAFGGSIQVHVVGLGRDILLLRRKGLLILLCFPSEPLFPTVFRSKSRRALNMETARPRAKEG